MKALLLGERANHFVQATFVPSRFVFMDDALADHRVNDRYGSTVTAYSGVFVAGVDRFDDIFDVRAHFRA